MAIDLVVTEAGRAALVNAANTGTNQVTIAQAGLSATAIVATPTTTALAGEFARVTTIGGGTAADDTIHMSIRDEVARAYSLRSIALYLSDGTLFALYGQAAPILTKTVDTTALIALDVKFADISAASLVFGDTNFTDAAATTSMQGIVELATTEETQAGADATRAITPAALAAALMVMLLARDGAGSGLDADLLDGQQGSFYSNIPARLGFTPVNRAGDTMTGPLTLAGDPTAAGHAARKSYVDALVSAAALGSSILLVDGSGSGLDADLLDGQHGSYYADVLARLGFTPVNRAGDTMLGQLLLVGDPTANAHATRKAYVDALAAEAVKRAGDTMTGQLTLPGDPVSANHAARKAYVDALVSAAALGSSILLVDGSGSGLDADLLDGQHGAWYANIIARLGYTPVDTAGDAMTGPLSLSGDPTANAHAARKAYVDGLTTAAALLAKLLTVDGAGSGLDADLLDGLHASFLRDLANATGTLPNARVSGSYDGIDMLTLNRLRILATNDASETSTLHGLQIGTDDGDNLAIDGNEIVCRSAGVGAPLFIGFGVSVGAAALLAKAGVEYWHPTNDGAGSGLDADLLDGQQGSWYSNIIARLGYTPVDKSGDAMTGQLSLVGDPTAAGHAARKAYVDGLTTAAALLAKLLTVDGSGSGIDADLLDGKHASAFALDADFTSGSNANGYWEKRPGGIIEQWGRATGTFAEGQNTRTFPIAFTDAASVSLQVIPINTTGGTGDTNDIWAQGKSNTTTTFSFMFQQANTGATVGGFMWRAIGK